MIRNKKILFWIPLVVSFLFVCLLSVKINDNFLAVHDSPFLLTQEQISKGIFSLWNENNFGHPDYLRVTVAMVPRIASVIFYTFTHSTKFSQLLYYFLIINVVWYAAYYAFQKILRLLDFREVQTAAFVGSLFYTFNLYMITSWHGGVIDSVFHLFAIAPLLLYYVLVIIQKGYSLKYVLLVALGISLTINTGPFSYALYLVLFTPALILYFRKITIRNILYSCLLAAITLLLSLWTLYPLIMQYLRFDSFATSSGLTEYQFNKFGLLGFFRLYLDWTVDAFWRGRYFHSYYPYYKNIITTVILLCLWFISLSVFLHRKNRERNKHILLYILSALLFSLFFAKNILEPFGEINKLFYQYVPLFGIFRTPDTKFGLSIVLILSLLISYAFIFYKGKKTKAIIFICVILHIGVFFTAIPIVEQRAANSYDRIVRIPDSYKQLATLINSDKAEGNVLFYPELSYGNYDYKNGYGLSGQDILGELLTRPVIYNDQLILGKSKQQYAVLTKTYDSKELSQSRIRYILVRKDVDGYNTGKTIQALSNRQGISLVRSTNTADLFMLTTQLENTFSFISGNKEYIPGVTKESPTKYTVSFSSLPKTGKLIFREAYHPDWQLNATSLSVTNHQVFDNTFNMWNITNTSTVNREKDMIIEFTPQKYFKILSMISLSSFLVILAILVGIEFNERRRQYEK